MAETDDDPLALANQMCFATYAASLAFSRRYRTLLADMGLTYPQYLCLLVLWRRDGLALKEIGEQLGLDSGTLTPLLRRLEAQGLLTRRRDGADERQMRVTLTAQGRALREKAASLPAQLQQATGLAPAELAALRDRLEALRLALLADAERAEAGAA